MMKPREFPGERLPGEVLCVEARIMVAYYGRDRGDTLATDLKGISDFYIEPRQVEAKRQEGWLDGTTQLLWGKFL